MHRNLGGRLYRWVGAASLWIGAMSGVGAFAETGTTAATVPAPSQGEVVAGIDLRPSWDPLAGVFRTENMIEVGYQFRPARSVTYVQTFTSNISTPGAHTLGLDAKLDRGYLRTVLGNLLVDESLGLKFGYQNRIYVPTAGYDQASGMALIMRNYFTLAKKFSNSFSMSLTEMPVFHVNQRAGNITATGAVANMDFHNRIYLQADIKFSEKVSLAFPLMFHQQHYASYQVGAKNNAAWDYLLWIYPEITYSLTSKTSLGLAYYSANLIKADLSGFDLAGGLEKGTLQLAFTSYL